MEYCQGGDLRALIRKKLHEEEYFSYSQVQTSADSIRTVRGLKRPRTPDHCLNSDSNLDDSTEQRIRSNTRG